MNKENTAQQKKTGLCLWQGPLTVEHIATFKEELSATLGKVEGVLLDLSGATEIDPSFMQFLCSAHRSAMRVNKELSLTGAAHLLESISESGFDRHIGCSHDCYQSCLWVRLSRHKATDRA